MEDSGSDIDAALQLFQQRRHKEVLALHSLDMVAMARYSLRDCQVLAWGMPAAAWQLSTGGWPECCGAAWAARALCICQSITTCHVSAEDCWCTTCQVATSPEQLSR